VIAFKEPGVVRTEGENEITRVEIDGIWAKVSELRGDFDDLAKEIAIAAEKLKIVRTRVNLNNEDERCEMENVPPELGRPLPPLDTIATKLKDPE
jgi:hypothetical protein